MIKKIRYGFLFEGIEYGWIDKELYRLPSLKGNRNLPFKKLNLVIIGKSEGYRLSGKPKTIKQLEEFSEVINYELVLNGKGSKDCPF